MQLFIFYLLLFVQLIIFECHSHLSNIWFVWVFPEESSCVFSCQKVFVSILHFSFVFIFCRWAFTASQGPQHGSKPSVLLCRKETSNSHSWICIFIQLNDGRKKDKYEALLAHVELARVLAGCCGVRLSTRPLSQFFHFSILFASGSLEEQVEQMNRRSRDSLSVTSLSLSLNSSPCRISHIALHLSSSLVTSQLLQVNI